MSERKQLIPTEKYLTTGSHIGTTFKNGDMQRFIFKKRKDGLFVLNVETIDERLETAANFLSQFPLERIAVVARRLYGQAPAKKFSELTGAKAIVGRFIPGTFTNPLQKTFVEPAVVIVTDPETDSQAILEANRQCIPVVALTSTHNSLRFVDLAIPINNKGRKSLALAFWVLCRELLKHRGDIKDTEAFASELAGFEYQLKNGEESTEGEEAAIREAIQESQKIKRNARKGKGKVKPVRKVKAGPKRGPRPMLAGSS